MGEKRHLSIPEVALQGLIEEIVLHEPERPPSETPAGSGFATSQDALHALTLLARAIEAPAYAGDLPPDHAYRMASMLLVIRDFIQPLRDEADEHVSRYLADVVEHLR